MDSNIRSLYAPIQPGVELANEYISYREFLPHQKLQNDVYCYWQLQTNEILPADFNYRVVADGCIDIFFDANVLSECFVMGLCKQYATFHLGKKFNYIGIRFLPTRFPSLFKIDAKTLTNRTIELLLVQPEIAQFINKNLNCSNSTETTFSLLDQFLMTFLEKPAIADARLAKALETILKCGGILDTERDLDVGLSSRQLRRLFEFYTGTTPKNFCMIVRFQHFLKSQSATKSRRYQTLFLEAGYFDQSHFIKEFKKLYGLTPNHAFRR